MKKNVAAVIAVMIIMFGFPWAAVTFAPGDAGMAICFASHTISAWYSIRATIQRDFGLLQAMRLCAVISSCLWQ